MATRSTPRQSATLGWLPVISAAATATEQAIDEAVAVLESAGEPSAALILRREFGRWPSGHECAFTLNDRSECLCGASR